MAVDFDREVRLAGYDLEQEEGAVRLTLWWQALQSPADDYTVFVHLSDATGETIVAQSDAMPQNGAYPTSLWVDGEVVSETVVLDVRGAPAGSYRIAVGWYDPDTATRLPARDAEQRSMPLDRVVLDTLVEKRE